MKDFEEDKQPKPNKKEKIALTLFYNRFYDLYDEISNDLFFTLEANERFFKIKEVFSIYKELLGYEPIKTFLEYIKKGGRPPLEGIIAEDLFSFVRNLLLHYPIFETWNDVYITKDLSTWNKKGTIHKFLLKCTSIQIDGKGVIKYRIWSNKRKRMIYISINLPEKYTKKRIYLKDIISEQDGIKFCIALMKQILDSQVQGTEEPDIIIMSQVYLPSN